jgi:hypothetical protein
VSLRLLTLGQLKSGGYGLVCGAYPPLHDGVGNFCPGLRSLGWKATAKDCGVTVARPQGQSRVPDPLIGQQ